MKNRELDEAAREDIRGFLSYNGLFKMISGWLSKHENIDCRACLIIAVDQDGAVSCLIGARPESINYDFNQMLADIVAKGIDFNRPAEGGIN